MSTLRETYSVLDSVDVIKSRLHWYLSTTWEHLDFFKFISLILQEKRHSLLNSDVAAFATRAKVVYPINQKYRVSGESHSLHTVQTYIKPQA